MKNLTKELNMALLAIATTLVLFSCQKQDEISEPETLTQEEVLDTSHLDFHEGNTESVAWQELPAELREAERIEMSELPMEMDRNLISDPSELESLSQNTYPNRSSSCLSYYAGYSPSWGGNGGGSFSLYPTRTGSEIYAIAIRAGSYVDRIMVWYRDSNGDLYYGGGVGGDGGSYYIQFFSSDEYIHTVRGRSGAYLDRIEIYTNRKSFGYGGYGGGPFSYSMINNYGRYRVLGFYGRSGSFIDRIGLYIYKNNCY